MGRGQHRYGCVGRIDPQANVAEARNVGRFAAQRLLAQVRGTQMDVVTDAAVAAHRIGIQDAHLHDTGRNEVLVCLQIGMNTNGHDPA